MKRIHRLAAALLAGSCSSLLLAAGDVNERRLVEEASTGANWLVKGGSYRGDHYSPLGQITDGNVGELGLAWATDLPAADGISATPIVVDGVIYVSAAYSVVFAVDAATGERLWTFDPEVRASFAEHPRISWAARAQRGVAVWDRRVFVTTADCRLIALAAATGRPVWSKTTCDPALGYYITDSPYVGGGRVFVGNGGSESRRKNRGYVSAYAADDGSLLWRFFIVPSDDPAENDTPALKMAAATWTGDTLARYAGGGNNWNEMTYDPASNLLFFGTSGAYPYVHAARSPVGGDNLFLSSIVAVDAATGAYRWHYQTVDRDSWDYNATMNIVLADLTIGGAERTALLIAPKNGFHYTLDRRTGELLAVGRFARTTWASDIDLETGKPIYDPAGQYWNLDDGASALVWPNMWGAHSWHPMAYHPGHRLSFIPVIDLPARVNKEGSGEDIVMLNEVDGKPHAPGKLVALDPVTGAIRWSVDHALPHNGGVLATGGNLVFQGTADGRFSAYAADTGTSLWSIATGSAINAAPASYAHGDTQYVLVPVGAGGGLQYQYPSMHAADEADGPTRLLAFTLAGRDELAPAAPRDRAPPSLPALAASAERVAKGAALYAGACQICHGQGGVARRGGSVPDLRYSTAATHEAWQAIVVGGALRGSGMPPIDISADEAEAIRAYVHALNAALRE